MRSCCKQPLRQDQAVARVGVIRTHLHARQLADLQFFGGIVEQHAAQAVARILRANQMRQRHRHPLGRREPVFAIENHAVAAIEHQHGRAGTLVFALMDVQIGIFQIDRHLDALTPDRREQRLADIEVQRVAELILLRRAGRFDSGRQIARIVAPETRFSQRAEQIFQRLEAEEIERFVGDFEPRLPVFALPAALPGASASWSTEIWPSSASFCTRFSSSWSICSGDIDGQLFQHLLHLVVREKLTAFERFLNGPFQVFEGLLVPFRELHVRVVEAALEKEIGQRLHQILGVDAEIIPGVFREFDPLHG